MTTSHPSLLASAAAGALTVLLVWATNRLLNRKAEGRALIRRRDGERIAALTVHNKPLPVLDGHEPHYAIYAAPAGDPTTTCSCHGIPLADGDRILIWPIEALLCHRTYDARPEKDS